MEEENRDQAIRTLKIGETANFTVYTDGSAVEGSRNGGAAAIVTKGNPDNPVVVEVLKELAGAIMSSTQAELVALRMALDWLCGHRTEWKVAKVASDSQAALASLRMSRRGQCEELLARICRQISSLEDSGHRIRFVWVAGHSGLVGNDLADEAAGEASTLNQRSLAVL